MGKSTRQRETAIKAIRVENDPSWLLRFFDIVKKKYREKPRL